MSKLSMFAVWEQHSDRYAIVKARGWRDVGTMDRSDWNWCDVSGWLADELSKGLAVIPVFEGIKFRELRAIHATGAIVWTGKPVESIPDFDQIVSRLRTDHTYNRAELQEVLKCSSIMLDALIAQGLPVAGSRSLGEWFEGPALIQWFQTKGVAGHAANATCTA